MSACGEGYEDRTSARPARWLIHPQPPGDCRDADFGVPEAQCKMRTRQLWHWIYHRGVTDFGDMTNVSKELRGELARSFTLDRPEIAETQISERSLADFGVPEAQCKMRTRQLWHWIYHRGVTDFGEMTNVSKELRQALADAFTLSRPEIAEVEISEDGTRKYLIRLADGLLWVLLGAIQLARSGRVRRRKEDLNQDSS